MNQFLVEGLNAACYSTSPSASGHWWVVVRGAFMFCPVCGSEYVAGILTCGDCNVPLVPEPPVEEEEVFFDDPVVPAAEVWNPAEAEIVCSLLQAHEIPCILKAENQYAVDATYTIGPLARRRILVRESDLPRAQEILRASPVPDSQYLSDSRPPAPDPLDGADR